MERLPDQVIELKPGVNSFGRNSSNDHMLVDPAVSSCHCELLVDHEFVFVRDLGSTNGTYIDRQPVKESAFYSGQTLRIGPVEMILDAPPVVVALPELPAPPKPLPKKSRMLADGYAACLNHLVRHAVWECPGCERMYCDDCVRKMRRVGGAFLRFCPACSHTCEFSAWTEMMKSKKKSLFSKIAAKVKGSFNRTRLLSMLGHDQPPPESPDTTAPPPG